MSLNKIAKFDRRVILPSNTFCISKSNSSVQYKAIPAGSESDSAANFSLTVSEKQAIGRNLRVQTNLKLTFTGTSVAGNLLNIGETDALRFAPLNNALWKLIQVNLNEQSITFQPSQIFDPLSRFRMHEDNFKKQNSESPAFHDMGADYTTLLGGSRNPLSGVFDTAGVDGVLPRGAWEYQIISNTATSAVVVVSITENLFIPGFSYSTSETSALFGLRQLTVDLTYTNGSELARVWSHNAVDGNNITNIAVQVGQSGGLPASKLFCEVISLPPLYALNLNDPIRYPYSNLVVQNRDFSTLTSGASATDNFEIQTVNGIPNKIWVFVRPKIGFRNYTMTDHFASITGIDLKYGGVTTDLSSASIQQLYEVSERNGLDMQYMDFKKYCGSIICVKPGVDFQLVAPSEEASGSGKSYELSLRVSYTNNSLVSMQYECVAILEQSGYMQMQNGVFSVRSSGLIDRNDVVETQASQNIVVSGSKSEIYGGGIIDSLQDLIKSGYQFGQDLYKTGKETLPYMGLGMLEPTGGKMMSKSKLEGRYK